MFKNQFGTVVDLGCKENLLEKRKRDFDDEDSDNHFDHILGEKVFGKEKLGKYEKFMVE